jgi:hypothetical protein
VILRNSVCPPNLNPWISVTYRNQIDASNQNDVTSVDANVNEAEEKIREEEKMDRSEKKPESCL